MSTAPQWLESSGSCAVVEEDLDRFYPAVLEFFRRRLTGGRRAVAEDLAQETVFGAWIAFRARPPRKRSSSKGISWTGSAACSSVCHSSSAR
jgi:DNA-directed RNA polymerase specialized sigma24 family protein